MEILKVSLLIIAAIIVILLIASLFVKKAYAVVREITINKPKTQVFDYIKYLKNQNSYSKWALMDPAMKATFTGADATPGFISAWEGNKKVGKGEQEIKKITEGEKLETEIRFEKPFQSTANAYMTTASAGAEQTRVAWGFSGHSPWPLNLMNLFMDKMVGGDLQTGLNNLKGVLERVFM